MIIFKVKGLSGINFWRLMSLRLITVKMLTKMKRIIKRLRVLMGLKRRKIKRKMAVLLIWCIIIKMTLNRKT